MRLLLLAAAAIGVHAAPLNILNPSFELGTGQFGSNWQGTCGSCGVFVDSGFDFTPGPPDGTRTLYVNQTVGVHQVLSDVALPNMVYTIDVMVGDRLFVPFAGSKMRLYAGPNLGAATLLAEVVNTTSPGDGLFAARSLTFTTPGAAGYLGQNLIVWLGGAITGTVQTHYDLVSGDATPTPEPAAWVMVAGVLGVIAARRATWPAKARAWHQAAARS